MSVATKNNFPIGIAAGATVLYLLLFFILFWAKLTEFKALSLQDAGTFMSGLASPIAIFWLIATIFIQQTQLKLQIKEMRQQLTQFEGQKFAQEESARQIKEYVIATNAQNEILKAQQISLTESILLEKARWDIDNIMTEYKNRLIRAHRHPHRIKVKGKNIDVFAMREAPTHAQLVNYPPIILSDLVFQSICEILNQLSGDTNWSSPNPSALRQAIEAEIWNMEILEKRAVEKKIDILLNSEVGISIKATKSLFEELHKFVVAKYPESESLEQVTNRLGMKKLGYD